MDKDCAVIFETLVYEANSFAGAIQLAYQDADQLHVDLDPATWVSVKVWTEVES